MGNCWGKESGGSDGRSSSRRHATSSLSPISGSGPGTSSQQNLVTSQPDATSKLLQGLRADVKDLKDLKTILLYFEKALDKYRQHPNSTIEVPELISGNLEDAEKALEQISTLCQNEVGKRDTGTESWTVLRDVFEGLENLHYVGAAFSMVAIVLKRLDQAAQNLEDCIGILESLHRLGKHLVDLLTEVPNEDQTFRRATALIVDGAIICISQLDSGYAKRFTFANTSKGSLLKVKEQIGLLYPDLNLTLTKSIHSNLSKRLKTYEAKYPEHAVGLQQTVRRIVDEILGSTQQTAQQKIQAILLYGMGGMGKTTLGEAVCAELSSGKAISIAKVEIGLSPTSEQICDCQSSIYQRLSGKNQRIGDPNEGRTLLEDHCKERSTATLLFVDNVFKCDDLEKLLPHKLLLPSGSYILVTSRSERISDALFASCSPWKSYDVKGLERQHAETLLSRHLRGCPEDMEEQFKVVVDLCEGWPLALEVIGSHLRRHKDKARAWKSAIDRLGLCRGVSGLAEDKLESILRWTYDQVDEGCKSVFLDISCLLKDVDWDCVDTLGFGSEAETLKDLSLVKRVKKNSWIDILPKVNSSGSTWRRPSDFGTKVQVHDLFVTLGRQASTSSPKIRVYSREGLLPSMLQDDHHEDECKFIEGLVLEGDVSFSGKKLDAMHNTLRILCLGESASVHGECYEAPSRLQICSVQGGRWKRDPLREKCVQFPYRDLTYLQDLRVLDVQCMGAGCSLDFETVHLPASLQILRLGEIAKLSRFHRRAFENCGSLHTVIIERCTKLQELPASICFCPIRVLMLVSNHNLNSLPPDLSRLQSLESFYCWNCYLEEFPAGLASLRKLRKAVIGHFRGSVEIDFSQLSSLKHLFIDYDAATRAKAEMLHQGFQKLLSLKSLHIVRWRSIQSIPGDLQHLTALKTLSLRFCESLTDLPDGLENLAALTNLVLWGCQGLQLLPEGLCKLTALEVLSLDGCTSLRKLPEELGNLLGLSSLNVADCKSLQELPAGLCQLTALEVLKLDGCTSLTMLPEEFGNLLGLSSLNVARCKSLQELPAGLCQLTALEVLNLDWCTSLRMLPEEFSKLLALSRLNLAGCQSLQILPEGFCQLSAMKILTMIGCTSLRMLPGGFHKMLALSHLNLADCTALQELPDGIGRLTALKFLSLRGCSSLRELRGGFGELSLLSMLDLGGMHNLEEWPDGLSQLTALQTLRLHGRQSLVAASDFGALKALKSLTWTGCETVTGLPEELGNLVALTDLNLMGCKSLCRLPGSFLQLRSLERLWMEECEALEELPAGFGDLVSLKSIELKNCNSLRNLSDGFGNLRALGTLYLWGCENLQQLPDSFFGLTSLRVLRLRNCKSLRQLPAGFQNLCSLTDFSLEGCPGLAELPEKFGELSALSNLELRDCTTLKRLPDGIIRLKLLEDLSVSGCCSLEELPQNLGELSALSYLGLDGCTSLKSIPESIVHLKGLCVLDLNGCDLDALPSAFGDFGDLKKLSLVGWKKLRALPGSMVGLKELKRLDLTDCSPELQWSEVVMQLESKHAVTVRRVK